MKFRKRPVEIEATQWWKIGDHDQVIRFSPDYVPGTFCSECNHDPLYHGQIKTLEGWHIVCPGDWIITGVKGEFYPCKPDIFTMTYDEVLE